MAINDLAIVETGTRVRNIGRCLVIDAAVVTWPLEHEQSISWVAVRSLPLDSTATDIAAARLKLVKCRTYFSLCHECHERRIKGDMDDAKICMRCAENNHGVVY